MTYWEDEKYYRLHRLCSHGNLNKVIDFVQTLDDDEALKTLLSCREGLFGYTPLHKAVVSGRADILDYLLERTKGAHVNCKSLGGGFTPLSLAASYGHLKCVKTLLDHNADIYIINDTMKTPRELAKLSCKPNIVRVLVGKGQ